MNEKSFKGRIRKKIVLGTSDGYRVISTSIYLKPGSRIALG